MNCISSSEGRAAGALTNAQGRCRACLASLRLRIAAAEAGRAGPCAKWCLFVLVLLAPGSFLVLPLLWLRRHWPAPGTAITRYVYPARSFSLIAAIALLLVTNGCSVRNYAMNSVGDALAGSGSGFAVDDDPELIRGAAPFSLKLMESVLSETPRHAGLLAAASSGFAQYAYAFVQQDADEIEGRDVAAARALRARARGLYHRARDYGLRALDARHPGFRAQLETDTRSALARLSRDDSAQLYWTSVAWAAAISLSKDSPMAIADLRLVDPMVERLRELDPDMDHGALHTFFISYEMGRPGARSPETRARRHFEQAVRLSSGQKAGPYVAVAESVSVAAQSRREFVDLLQTALAIDTSVRPEWRLENTIMQRRARWLLTQADQLFLD